MKTLKNRLKEKLENCYLFEGEDYQLYLRGFSMIMKKINLAMPDFNLIKFDDENFSAKNVVDACEVLPIGDQYRVILIKNVEKISESDKKLILSYIKNPCASSILVIFDYNSKFSSLKTECAFVDCSRFDKATLANVVVSELDKRGKKISAEALDSLLEYCNFYLTRIMCELDKLVYYDIENPLITQNIVEMLVSKDEEVVVFSLTEAMGQRNADKALKILESFKKEQGIFSLIVNHFRRMFFVSISNLTDSQLAQLLNIKEFAIKKLRGQTKNFSKMQLKKIFSLLEETDFLIKSGAMLQENALYFLVLSILYV